MQSVQILQIHNPVIKIHWTVPTTNTRMNNPKAECKMGNKGNRFRQEFSSQIVRAKNSAHRLSERTYQTHTCGFLQSDICYFPCSFIAAHSIDTAAGKKGGLHNNQYICAFKEDYNNWGKLSVSFKSVGFKKKSSDEWQAFNGCPWSKMLCPTGYSYYICKQGQTGPCKPAKSGPLGTTQSH